MPITGKSLGEVTAEFTDHLNGVLNSTVTQARLVHFSVSNSPPRMSVSFRQAGSPMAAPLSTNFGKMWLTVSQLCESTIVGRNEHQLGTVAYRYALTAGEDPEADALFRWEYLRTRQEPDAMWCRHHFHSPISLPLEGNPTLTKFHLPTGYVTIEEVLRFCIVDLGVEPLDEKGWDTTLEDSYRQFKASFAP